MDADTARRLHLAIIAGDEESFVEFARLLAAPVARMLRRMGLQDADVDEIWNDALLIAHQSARGLKPIGQLPAYTVGAARNLARSRFRAAKRQLEEPITDETLPLEGPGSTIPSTTAKRLEDCRKSLTVREAVLANAVSRGLSDTEVASFLGSNREAVKKARQRAIRKLRRCMEEEPE